MGHAGCGGQWHGGHAAGEVASKTAVCMIERRYDRSVTESPRALQRAFHAANRHIYRTMRRQSQYPVWTLPVPVLPSEEEIKAIALGEDPTAACAQRIALAKTRGGYDNITVGVLRVNATATAAWPEDVSPQYATDRPPGNVAKEHPQ